ncbi:hypothetical protein KW798_01145, partial [Candidatus Parcubacteria bacterium]|nr:hypothetical protein [Candidatus Parcubacteria bacterium]
MEGEKGPQSEELSDPELLDEREEIRRTAGDVQRERALADLDVPVAKERISKLKAQRFQRMRSTPDRVEVKKTPANVTDIEVRTKINQARVHRIFP